MNDGHLKENKRWMLNLSDKERVDIILKHFWVSYPQADSIAIMTKNMASAKGRTHAPCLMITGDSGSGKSSMASHLMNLSQNWGLKFAYMTCAEMCRGMKFSESVVSALGAPNVPGRSRREVVPEELDKFLQGSNLKALIIDEFHDAMLMQKADQLKNLSFLKGLTGEPFFLTVIALGTPLALNALKSDQQLFRRFDYVHLLGWEENDIFRSFLASVEENLPLKKPSSIYQKQIVKYLLAESKGNMASTLDIIRFGAIQAVISGEEHITLDLLKVGRSLRWMYSVK